MSDEPIDLKKYLQSKESTAENFVKSLRYGNEADRVAAAIFPHIEAIYNLYFDATLTPDLQLNVDLAPELIEKINALFESVIETLEEELAQALTAMT